MRFSTAALGFLTVLFIVAGCTTADQQGDGLQTDIGGLSHRMETYERLSKEDHESRISALSELRSLIENTGSKVARRQQQLFKTLTPQMFHKQTGSATAENSAKSNITTEDKATETKSQTQTAQQKPVQTQAVEQDVRSIALFRNAYAYYQRQEFDTALRDFKQALEVAETDSQRARCLYWIGQVHYVNKDWQRAVSGFRTVYEEYPNSTVAPSALLKQALASLEQGDVSEGKACLQLLIRNYPDAEETPLAKERLQELTNS